MLSRRVLLQSALGSAVSAALPRPAAAALPEPERLTIEGLRRGLAFDPPALSYADFERDVLRQIAAHFALPVHTLEQELAAVAYRPARLSLEYPFSGRPYLDPDRGVPSARAVQLSPGLGHCPAAEGDLVRSGARRVGDASPGSGASQKG